MIVAKRIFIVGPPGSQENEKAQILAEEFKCITVSVKGLLECEVNLNSEMGERIKKATENMESGKLI